MNCEWSLWGSWSECSVTCGPPGDGLQTRGRHIHQKAENGGRKCTGEKVENRICPHEKLQIKGPDGAEIDKAAKKIYFCPGILDNKGSSSK